MPKNHRANLVHQAAPAPAPTQVLNRLSFGQTPELIADFQQLGLAGWLDRQLRPAPELALEQRLAQLKIRIKYAEAKDWAAVDEARPLQWLDAPLEKLWPLADYGKPKAGQERARPRVEVAVATLLRGAYSQYQLKELIVDFWHNHFSVNAHDGAVGVALPAYDRDVIRAHGLGNFRELLQAVATSTCMLISLNNRSSRAGAPNENYARELFELHTLGRDAYLNSAYDHWRQVPGAEKGHPEGYIDQDVYEAARAFTGWGLEDGTGTGMGQALPRTGKFTYVDAWHDQYQKRVLGLEFDPYQPPMTDGNRVLDLVARHPATAANIIRKLAWRLGLGHPSPGNLKTAVALWTREHAAPDQIAQVVRHLVLRTDFSQAPARIRRPLELALAYVRAVGMEFTPTEGLLGELDVAGQRLFGWITPTGLPDDDDFWLGVNAIRRRWTLVAGLTENWWGTGPVALTGAPVVDGAGFLTRWSSLLFGAPQPQLTTDILNTVRLPAGKPLTDEGLARKMLAWLAMAPAFQLRGAAA